MHRMALYTALLLFGLLLLMAEVGYRLGRRRSGPAAPQLATVENALLGLLGLLLGFSYSMAEARFELRKNLVVEEANAIGTSWLRAGLLPEPERTLERADLRRYVDSRLAFYEAGVSEEKLRAARRNAARMQERFWARASAVAAQEPRAVTTGLLLQSLNEVIDLDAKRQAALENHVPTVIPLLLCLIAVLALSVIGYGGGHHKLRGALSTTLLAMAIAAVFFTILDLDLPRQGLIRISQRRMIELRESLNRE